MWWVSHGLSPVIVAYTNPLHPLDYDLDVNVKVW